MRVELGVAVTVVAILATLSIPLINTSRQSAMQVENVSNLRALGLASLTYANANDGKLPPNTKGTSSETASTLGYSLHDGASPRKLLNKGSFNLLGSKGDYDYISIPDVFYGPFAERIARLRQPGTFFKDPSSGLWLIGYLYFFQTEENPIVPGLSNDHLTGEPLSVSLIWEDEQQRIELHEFPYTKVRVTMAYNAEGGWDGRGFDISEGTRAWDIPANQSISDIVGARANLSARYVKFWNLLYERLRELNPDVVMVSYAYSAYRNPPPPERPLTANMILGIVHSYNAYAPWKGWAENGASLFLRPNWWHHGADAPYLPLEEVSRYVKFAWENNMIGIDMDSVIGYWATQGINYYMVARLMTRPDLSLEQIIDEYVEGFGDGADKIKAYINYWQGVTSEYNYDGGSNIHGDYEAKKSRYKELVAEGRLSRSTLNGSKYALPLLYGDEVIAPAEELLDEAEAAIGQSDPLALQRVAFLRSGLDSLRATRDQIALGQQLLKDPDAQTYRAFAEGAEALDVLRDAWAADNVMWGQSILQHENRYKVLIRPENIKNHNINLDGL